MARIMLRRAEAQMADRHLACPTFTEAVGLGARKLIREPGMAPLAATAGAIEPLYS